MELVRRYEFLVEELLSGPVILEGESLNKYMTRVRKAVIERELKAQHGNVRGTSKQLKMPRSSLIYLINELRINTKDYK